MGVGISGWKLARAVSMEGQLGVVSGTACDVVLARRLQCGDADGAYRRALAAFPYPEVSQRILEKYFLPNDSKGGHRAGGPFLNLPLPSATLSRSQTELMVLASFAEVYLSKVGHTGVIGINLLEKIQVATLPTLYGAMLAGVDVVLMGAGIPLEIPGVLDRLADNSDVSLKLDVIGAQANDSFTTAFSPKTLFAHELPPLSRPAFLAIVSSHTLAMALVKRANGAVNGFVVESPTAGGHNAPPRGEMTLDSHGEPIYGVRDNADLDVLRKMGLPFWLAGGFGSSDGLQKALESGATGIQVGTLFALCEESGMEPQLKSDILKKIFRGELKIKTDPRASPTGFPFKVAEMEETCSDDRIVGLRPRRCDLGYLRKPYKRPDGSIGYRCPGEPEDAYLKKGGKIEDTVGRKCLCNGLVANLGLPQVHSNGFEERALVTLGNAANSIRHFLEFEGQGYSARQVLNDLLGRVPNEISTG